MRKGLKKIVSLLIACACVFSSAPSALADNDTTSNTLGEGTYTVTANLYVPGIANDVLPGTTAYLTNTQLPPLEGAVKNAKLEIKEDGTRYLTVTNMNRFFALQKISSTEDAVKAMIISTETVSDYPQYYTSRINTITFKLNEDDDTYNFDDCEEFAVPLAGTGKANKTMPLQLKVDFSSAEQGFDDSQIGVVSWELNDSATGCKVIVSSSEESIIARMTNASLRVEEVTGDEKDSLFNKLSEDYDGNVEGNIYNFVLEDGNKEVISLTGNTQASVTFPNKYEQPIVYCFDNDKAEEVSNAVCVDEKTIFAVKTLGKYGFVNWKNRIHTISYESTDNSGVSFTYRFPMRYVDTKGFFSGNVGVSKAKQNGNDTEYYIGIQNPLFGGLNGAKYADGAQWKITLPYENGDHVYLVRHAKEKSGYTGKKYTYTERYYTVELNGDVANNTISFDLFDEALGFSQSNREEIAERTYVAYKGKKLDTRTNKTQIYLLVSKNQYADTPYPYLDSEDPDSSRDFRRYAKYMGKSCSAYMLGKNTKIEGTSQAVDAAEKYTFTVTPNDGYTWYKDSAEKAPRTIEWDIDKAGLEAKYDGQIIRLGETPEQRVTVTGFVNDETEKTAADYVKPTVDFSNITSEGEYPLKPANGSAKNYSFDYSKGEGTLKVLPATAKIIDKPTAVTGLKENNGETLIGVKEGEGYTLTNNTATKKGEYTAVAKLLDGYYWSDGTRDDVEIPWSVAKGSSGTVTNPDKDKTETVTANLYMDGANNTILPGVTVYLNNPNNPIKGTGTPTTPQSDNATLKTEDGKMYLTLKIANPVFTLQKIDGCSNASVDSKKTASDLLYQSGVSGKRSSRISEITFLLDDKSGTYTFEDCEEFPTIINPENNWNNPLILKVKFSGGDDSSLDSKTDVDTSKITGGSTTPEVKTDLTVKVKDDTATVSKINTDDLSSKNSITLDVTDGNKGVTGVNLPVSALEKIVDAKVPGTTLTLSDTSAKFDLAALTEVTKAASGKTVDLRILTGTDAEKKLSASEKSAMSDVKNASAVSVALSSDDKAITSLGSGKLTVSVPFKWDGKGAVRAYQVDANGKLVSVPVTCKNNVAELTLTGTGNFILGTVDTKSFDDVADDAFYKTAVDWAVENGVTSGISDTLFAPAKTCTRAQVVTFLWRAAGSPEPTKTENPFTDVKSDAYYYKAVLWALEKGITSGTSATTFAPENVVSRAQVVTFQWRMADSAKANGTNNFTDVPADSYYKDAVQWAAEKGITSGTSATTFAPNAGCTRGQIVTFLYRQLGK